MASDLIDLTLPAHDPNFLKLRGLLAVPPEVEEQVASMEARILREKDIQINSEARQWMRDDWTLRYYYDGAILAYRRRPQGVEVLAVGYLEASKFLDDRAPDWRQGVRVGTV